MAVERILFTFYPLYVRYNHGLALLSALCEEKGIDTDLYILDDVQRFTDYVTSRKATHIAFSCVTEHDYKLCLPFMKAAKGLGCILYLGGVYIRRGLPSDAPVDYICRGEGETLPDFLLYGDDRLFTEKMLCRDINALPLPNYELFKNIPFERGTPFLEGKKVLPYYSSRGCSYKCSFCEVQGQPRALRFRCQVQDDLRILSEVYSPDIFFMGDELLPYYNERWRDSWGDFRHPFTAYIRADISEESLLWLHDRGMVGCAFGIESGDERYRNEVLNKNLTDKDIYRTVGLLKKLDIKYAAFYMTNTPQETFAIRAKTCRMAQEIGGYPYIWEYENLFAEVMR